MEPGSSDWWEHRLEEMPGLSWKQVKDHGYFEIALDSDKVTPRWKGGPGTALRDIFMAAGLFEDVVLEEKVGLGDYVRRIDVFGSVESTDWVVECDVPPDEATAPDTGRAEESIERSLPLANLHRRHYKKDEKRNVLPGVCSLRAGSSSQAIIDVCRMAGVSAFEVVGLSPEGDLPRGGSLCVRVHYPAA